MSEHFGHPMPQPPTDAGASDLAHWAWEDRPDLPPAIECQSRTSPARNPLPWADDNRLPSSIWWSIPRNIDSTRACCNSNGVSALAGRDADHW